MYEKLVYSMILVFQWCIMFLLLSIHRLKTEYKVYIKALIMQICIYISNDSN